ncbi:uncharacterized protein VTP21DRAFT_11501 [Calcarisporiella thermophila]|uniref:uncharacterized protein n=1 Tax=Calcarisporiella thermophila TaxID=911321 RepID=UPI0037420FCD
MLSYFKSNKKGKVKSLVETSIPSPEPSSPLQVDEGGKECVNKLSPVIVESTEISDPFGTECNSWGRGGSEANTREEEREREKCRAIEAHENGRLIYVFRGKRIEAIDFRDEELTCKPRQLWPTTNVSNNVHTNTRNDRKRRMNFVATNDPPCKKPYLTHSTTLSTSTSTSNSTSASYVTASGSSLSQRQNHASSAEKMGTREKELVCPEDSPENPFLVSTSGRIERERSVSNLKSGKDFGVVFRGKRYPVSEEALFGSDTSPFQESIKPRSLLSALLAAKGEKTPVPMPSICLTNIDQQPEISTADISQKSQSEYIGPSSPPPSSPPTVAVAQKRFRHARITRYGRQTKVSGRKGGGFH